jgi:opacity protein-like surface antigen
MIRKFRTVPGLGLISSAIVMAMLAGVPTVSAQQTEQAPAQQPQTQPPQPQQPEAQQPADQQSGSNSQEASTEETTRTRKVKNYKNWTFNVDGGASLTNGTTAQFVRGGGGIIGGGVTRNASKYFGLRLDFQFDNLPLRNSALELAQAPSAINHAYTLMLDPVINISASKNWGGYIVFGASFVRRSGKLDSSSAIPGSACNPFFTWWGDCYASSLPISGRFLHENQNELGYNFGGGITRKVRGNTEVYVEFRYVHGKHNGFSTDFRPITLGVRW